MPFLVIDAGDLQVFLNGDLLTSGYNHTGIGNPTSTITFAIPSTGDHYLQLSVPFQRLIDYQENGYFLVTTVNRDFDRIWQALKQLLRYVGRALTLGPNDVDGAGAYRAKGNRIADLADPIDQQDAATKKWSLNYLAQLISVITGNPNLAANVYYQGADGLPHVVQDLSSGIGSNMVGHTGWQGNASNVGADLRSVTQGIIYADEPRFGGNIENAITAVGNNMTLVIRQPYTVTKPLRVVGKTNPIVCCVGAGRLLGSRTAQVC